MSTLAKAFNVGAVQGGHYQRMDVTLTWDSDVPMEFRLHMWQPASEHIDCDCKVHQGSQEVEVIWSVSRDLLVKVVGDDNGTVSGINAVTATRVRVTAHATEIAHVDWTYLSLESDAGQIRLSFRTEPLASFVRTSLAMCPTESEAIDVDGLIHKIFHAEEADQ